MVCGNCQHLNPDNTKFCENCGKPLERICPNCGRPNSAAAKFCGNCGYNLSAPAPIAALKTGLAEPPAPVADLTLERLEKLVPKEFAARLLSSRHGQVERERRIVTILFCDVKGSTALGEERDPEEIMEIMSGAFDNLIEPIYRYEGTLARLMGDAILAFFGAPIAHEDDPVRAVLAGLAIQEKMKVYAAEMKRTRGIENFGVRVGINTGLVVVGEVGSDLRVEYTAMGDAINLASRLETAAVPGTIVISENTARRVQHAIELESLGGLELKGKSEPVPAYRVVGEKATPESARGIAGLNSPLVGRDKELNALKDAVDELLEGRGQIVSLMGEAGLGKSRLLAELRKATALNGPTWLEGRSLSYETNTPYAPFIELLNTLFDLRENQTDLDQYDQIEAKLNEFLPGRGTELAPFIATLLGIELIGTPLESVRYLPPPMLRGRITGAMFELFSALAARNPTILIFEDLHWADTSSLDLLEAMLTLTEQAPLLIMALFRPTKQEPSWRFHEAAGRDYSHRYRVVMLEPLNEAHSRELVANLLEIEDLPESVRALILKKAEGNPFFVEEVIRSLLDQKLVIREEGHWKATKEIANIQVPDTLAAVITARLDRLDEDSRHAAQTAAVIGREFEYNVLAEVDDTPQTLDPSLTTLQRRELVREKSRIPQRAYLFKHAITQETAYGTVLLSKRRELHKRVAEVVERVAPEHINDIARHFLEAQENARALPYLIGAGERAARGYSTSEAIMYYSKAIELTKSVDNLSLARRAYEGLGGVQTFGMQVPQAVQTYEEMLEIGQTRDDVPMQVSAMNKLSMLLGMYMGQFPEAQKHLEDAERLAQEHQDKAGLSESYFIRCGFCTSVGDFEGVVRYMDQAAQYGHDLGVKDQIAAAKDHTSRSQVFMTQFEAGKKGAAETLALAREIGNREIEGAVQGTLAVVNMRDGDLESAKIAAKEMTDISARIGSALNHADGAWILGNLYALQGDYGNAFKYLQESVQAAFPLEQMLPFMLVMPLAALGRTYVEISPVLAPRAAVQLDHARELLTNPGGMVGGGTGWLDVGLVDLALGKVDGAIENFQKGLNYPTMLGFLFKPQFFLGMAMASLEKGQLDQAAQFVNDARTFAEERAMQDLYPRIAYLEGRVRTARDDNAGALEQFARAEGLAAKMQMRPVVLDARIAAARSLDALGRKEEADAKRSQARTVIDEMANLVDDEKLREQFLASAEDKLKESMTNGRSLA